MFADVRIVLSQCNSPLRLLHLSYDIEVMWQKTMKHAFSVFYALIKHGFLTTSEHTHGPIYVIIANNKLELETGRLPQEIS